MTKQEGAWMASGGAEFLLPEMPWEQKAEIVLAWGRKQWLDQQISLARLCKSLRESGQ